jgi:hypothetical protein
VLASLTRVMLTHNCIALIEGQGPGQQNRLHTATTSLGKHNCGFQEASFG